MNHKPSQFCGPPTREGATLNVPLPQSATLSDMCVNGPIVYECLDSVLRSQVHLLQRDAPMGHHPLPLVGEARSPAARVACAREWTDELCVLGCVRDWEYARLGENACRDGKKIPIQHLKRNKIEKCNNEVRKGFRKEILPLKERLILKSLNGRALDMGKKKIVIARIIFLFSIIVKLVLIDTGQCYWQVWSCSALY